MYQLLVIIIIFGGMPEAVPRDGSTLFILRPVFQYAAIAPGMDTFCLVTFSFIFPEKIHSALVGKLHHQMAIIVKMFGRIDDINNFHQVILRVIFILDKIYFFPIGMRIHTQYATHFIVLYFDQPSAAIDDLLKLSFAVITE